MTPPPEQVSEQPSRTPAMDKGPWLVASDGSCVSSEDFIHDVWLRISGDFADDEERKRYARQLAAALNAFPKLERENTRLLEDRQRLVEALRQLSQPAYQGSGHSLPTLPQVDAARALLRSLGKDSRP